MIQITDQLLTPPVPLVYSGKVRDTYDLGSERFLMVASDRISAFDVVLPSVVPGKGVVLTQLSNYWFERLTDIVPNHLSGETVADLGWGDELAGSLSPRSMVVRKAERIPIECVVRGYLAGSGWVEYQKLGSVAGHKLPIGLQQSERLPKPIFTPARKNDSGHDENITVEQLRQEIGDELAGKLEKISTAIYTRATTFAKLSKVIIADTKFEFGFIDGELTLIDEVLTPDSSRFWDASMWQPGSEAASFDKQFVRNWLLRSGWNREAPGPELPADVIAGTQERYQEAFSRITGYSLEEWLNRERSGDIGLSDQVWRVEVIVMPKDGVSDPQGEAVKGGLGLLGIAGVQRVRVGRHLEIDVTAPTESAAQVTVHSMAEQLLANLVIEQFQISNVQRLDLAGVN